jgi:hypothetical protein
MAVSSLPAVEPVAVDPPRPGGLGSGAARFMFAPASLVGAAGWLRRPGLEASASGIDPRAATVDVVIPVCRDQATIVLCLAGLRAQTLRPRRVRLVEDCSGARDGTAVLAREFAKVNGFRVEVIEQREPGGRARALATQAAALDGDVMIVLDADTVLDSPDYLERCVHALYSGAGVAAACGARLPLRDSDRRKWAMSDVFRRWLGGDAWRDPFATRDVAHRVGHWFADSYAECVGLVQQRFAQRGQMRALGGVCHPCGAIAYRRRYFEALSQRYPVTIDDAPGARDEDLRLGFSFAYEGFRIVQVPDVVARVQSTQGIAVLPRERMRHTRAFLEGARRFRALLRAPLGIAREAEPVPRERRRHAEPHRQPFGGRHTHERGRPLGWAFACAALDAIVLPVLVIALLAAGQWHWLAWGVAIELGVWLAVLAAVTPEPRLAAVTRGLVVAPLRYVEIAADALAVAGLVRARVRNARNRKAAAAS